MEFSLFQMLRDLFQNLHLGALAGLCTGLFIIINILRGKVSIGDKQLKIPWLTDKFNSLAKELKTFILLGLFGIIGVLTTLSEVAKVTVWILLDGFLAGVMVGTVTLGIRQGYKQGRDGLKKVTQAIKEKRANKKNETPG